VGSVSGGLSLQDRFAGAGAQPVAILNRTHFAGYFVPASMARRNLVYATTARQAVGLLTARCGQLAGAIQLERIN